MEAIGVGPVTRLSSRRTFTATAEVVRYLGATPVIVDVEPDTLNIDLDAVAGAVTVGDQAVIPVHLLVFRWISRALRAVGAPTSASSKMRLMRCLHRPDGFVGTAAASDAAVFSFYATKTDHHR